MNQLPIDSNPKNGGDFHSDTSPGVSDDSTRIISLPSTVARDSPANTTAIAAHKSQVHSEISLTQTKIISSASLAPGGATDTDRNLANDMSLLPVGTRVAEFEITRLIGQGGFGVVYEAWDHTLERVVAIKEYMPSSLANRQSDGSVVPLSDRHKETFDLGMRSFINEARLLAQFDHPALLKVYRFWQERGTTYMVMPCYKGSTLKEALVHKETINEEWLLGIVDGVTQALAVMHRVNCYHRDIAPDNIMLLEHSGLPVVLDFGAARRVITDMTQAITVILKPGYAPIEQYAETPDMVQGAWTDIYALSAVMHVVITGHSPPPSVARMFNDHYVPLASNKALLERYSEHVLATVDAGLAVRPEARPQSMAQFRSALKLPQVDEVTTSQTTRTASYSLSGAKGSVFNGSNQAPGSSLQRAKPSAAIWATVATSAVIAIASVWWMAGTGSKSSTADVPAIQATTGVVQPAVNQQVVPTSTPATAVMAPFSPDRALNRLLTATTSSFIVTTKPAKTEVRIGKDKLEFQVQSNQSGFVYVYLLSTVGEMYLLFPNALDKRNRIESGAVLSLPKASWAMNADGPVGTDEFVVLVSEYERDLKSSGIQYEGVFGQFPMKILEALESARGTGLSPLLGSPICPGNVPCKDNYGVAGFKIVEK